MALKFHHNGIELEIPRGVYYPEEDSLLLAEAIERLDIRKKKCLDMGCGSGFLSIIMAKKGGAVTASDINRTASETAKANAEKNRCSIDAIVSSLFDSIAGKYDVIVFNPPYLPVDDKYTDRSYDGGRTGRKVIGRFLECAKIHLNGGGKILLLISSLTGENEVLKLAEKNGFKAMAEARKKIEWEELIVLSLALSPGKNRKELH